MVSGFPTAYFRAKHKQESLKRAVDHVMNMNTGQKTRITTAALREFLLSTCEPYFRDGVARTFKHKSLGAGVHEVWFEVQP